MERSVFSPARCVLAALCMVWLVSGTAIAQDPRASAAQAAARDWLMLIDRGDAQASWDAASERFRAAMPLSGWGNELLKERVPLGAMRSRAALKTSFTKIFPGVPEGDYALVSFETSFARRPQGRETVTLEHEDDGNWHVVGYFVR
ncbi:MAG TPA: DUF4019 domain-containing protein [Casimicrobiaceae bacterium]|jgi:hypothetical protein|nr:DUF4019 domain-containing protein [Casimicrobiaceae bacterium]